MRHYDVEGTDLIKRNFGCAVAYLLTDIQEALSTGSNGSFNVDQTLPRRRSRVTETISAVIGKPI